MKRIMLFLVFAAVSVFLSGCYTQFAVQERNYDDDKYAQRDDRDLYEREYGVTDSTQAGYRYYDDYRDYHFSYYSPMYSRFYWGYYPGRIGFYDYGFMWDNMWAYGWYNDPFYYNYFWHMGYPWNNSYYNWPYYYPRYYGDYWYGGGIGNGGSYYGYNSFSKERRNDGERLTGRSSFERLGGARTSLTGTSGFGRVVVGRNSGSSSSKETDRNGNTTSSGTRTRTGEKIFRDYNDGRTRTSDATRISTPNRLKEYTPPETSGSRTSSDRSGRVTTGSGYNGQGNYSNPNRSGSSSNSGSVGRSSSGSSSSSSGSSSRGSSSSSSGSSRGSSSSGNSSRGNEGGGRGRG